MQCFKNFNLIVVNTDFQKSILLENLYAVIGHCRDRSCACLFENKYLPSKQNFKANYWRETLKPDGMRVFQKDLVHI